MAAVSLHAVFGYETLCSFSCLLNMRYALLAVRLNVRARWKESVVCSGVLSQSFVKMSWKAGV